MESKLAELRNAVQRVGTSSLSSWNSYDALEAKTVELCQLLTDFLSRIYSCKNLAAVCAKIHGLDSEFKSLKHRMLGFEASVIVNLRNYVIYVDMMPLEIDTSSSRVVFTRRCRGDGIWTMQKRFFKETDTESLLTSYSKTLTCFYGEYFRMLMGVVHPKLGVCK